MNQWGIIGKTLEKIIRCDGFCEQGSDCGVRIVDVKYFVVASKLFCCSFTVEIDKNSVVEYTGCKANGVGSSGFCNGYYIILHGCTSSMASIIIACSLLGNELLADA